MDKSKIELEQILISKIKIVADRNERFAAISKKLEDLKKEISKQLNEFPFPKSDITS